MPVPTRSAKLSEWLPYWLDNVVKPRRKRSTYDKYEAHVRLYLVPMLGAKRLESLGVADVRRTLLQLEKKTTAATAKETSGEKWQDGGYVFATRNGRPVEPRNVYRSFTRVAQSAGLRVIRLHDARHGCATILTAAGVAPRVVMEILGHSQISITMDVYTHVVQDTQREAISHMDRLLKRRPGLE